VLPVIDFRSIIFSRFPAAGTRGIRKIYVYSARYTTG
jgi:hypothetical protein